jgi:hypothetical protein
VVELISYRLIAAKEFIFLIYLFIFIILFFSLGNKIEVKPLANYISTSSCNSRFLKGKPRKFIFIANFLSGLILVEKRGFLYRLYFFWGGGWLM